MENYIDNLMKLHELRLQMWECFAMLSKTPKDDPIIEEFIDLMDQHQGIISRVATTIRDIGEIDPRITKCGNKLLARLFAR